MRWLRDRWNWFLGLNVGEKAGVAGAIFGGIAILWGIYTYYEEPTTPPAINNSPTTASEGGTAILTTAPVVIARDPLVEKAFEVLRQELETKKEALKSALIKEQQYQNIINALKEAIEAIPKQKDIPDAEERIKRALIEATKGNTSPAETIFLQVERRKSAKGKAANKEAAEAARHRGALAFVHDPRRAFDPYRRAIELDPDNVDGWNLFASVATAYNNAYSPYFSKLDMDGDGALSIEEAAADPVLRESWGTADANQDGKLEQAEFSAFEMKAAESDK